MTSSLLSAGLPPRLVQHVEHDFQILAGDEPPLQVLVQTVGAFAKTLDLPDSAAIPRIFSLLAAACHALTRLVEPPPPFATNPPAVLLPTSEWLLLATRERALASLPPAVGRAIDLLVEQLDAASTTNFTTSVASPLTDYGTGTLLQAFLAEESAFLAGEALGKLTRLTLEVTTSTRPSGSFFAPILLQSLVAHDPEGSSRLRLAAAIACKPVPDKLPLMSLLGHSTTRAAMTEAWTKWSDAANTCLTRLSADVRAAFVTATSETLAQKTSRLRLFGLAKAPSLESELDRTIAMAIDALCADSELRESWEVQRWGGPFPRTCIARVFPVGLCMLALATASADISTSAIPLLSLRCPDGYRYFEGFDGIPPDTDLLGIVLQIVARIPADPERATSLVWPVELVVKNTHLDGEIPVWIDQYLREPVPESAPHWQGARCLAVAANCVIGLLEARVAVPDGFIDRAIGWIVRTWRSDGMRAVFFYGLSYTRLVLARLLEVADEPLQDRSVHDELLAIVDEIEASIVASRRSDGGFGSVLDTACCLAVLAIRTTSHFDPWPAIAFLASRQTHDGLWPAEPLYPVPGKDHAPAAHGTRPITTALCLYALARTRTRLSRDAPR